jgi:hypothetical protein
MADPGHVAAPKGRDARAAREHGRPGWHRFAGRCPETEGGSDLPDRTHSAKPPRTPPGRTWAGGPIQFGSPTGDEPKVVSRAPVRASMRKPLSRPEQDDHL